jgi:enoyl-CoA hydratase
MSATTVELIRQGADVARVRFRSENGVQILSLEVCDELRKIVRQLKDDADVRVVVFEAEGRTFLAGADLNELKALDVRLARKFARRGQRLFQRIAGLPAATIAAIHGACAGGGCEMALACDFRIAAAGARIGLPETTLGLIPGWGGTVRATLLLGASAAKRLILAGQLLSAAEAEKIGLVDETVSDERFRAAIDERIDRILKCGPAAVANAKRLIHDASRAAIRQLLEHEAEDFADCYATDEPSEGLAAFLEKRAAKWQNRGR